jgi:HEAT repeat protein
VRKAAVQAFSSLGPAARPATGKLIAALEDEEWLVRKTAVFALACVAPDDPDAAKALRNRLNDPEDKVSIAALLFERTLGDERE